ncbi:DegV family protein [Lacticaseibacillus porcinae]|uniref:DegV family protein n=1 Tax=Lacticaseibacillus porcinae TaxID=1123687 RepID=UPI000F76A24B|nr:DegV family protein [Lacticaseibacillus porcinae]
MTEKIAVLVDSGCDVPQTVIASHSNLAVVALNVRQNGVDYLDGVDLTPDEFYAHLTPDNLPQTASPSPAVVAAHLQDLFAAGYTKILALAISGSLSATYQGMRLAAQEFKAGDVMVLDTKSAGIGSGLLVTYASNLITAGREFPDVIGSVQHAIQHSGVWLYIPSLTYLQAGGRIGKVAGTLGSVLNIKPLLSVDDNGEIIAVAKVRSEKKAVQKLIDIALATAGPQATIAVAHGANFELLHAVTAQIEATGRRVEFTGSVSPAIGVHTGPGLIGIAVQNP